MPAPSFVPILEAARTRRGAAGLEARLPQPRSAAELKAVPDDRYLSQMSLRIFRAGLKHSIVDAKWPAFEEVFQGFEPRQIVAIVEVEGGIARDADSASRGCESRGRGGRVLHRDRRLSHVLELTVEKLIRADQCGLDTAIVSVWSGYSPGDGGWKTLPTPNSQWLMSLTAPLPGQTGQEVHYNILDGELLVGGKPLGRLPREIVGHPTYRRIFNQV